jgi:phage terminase small subunit
VFFLRKSGVSVLSKNALTSMKRIADQTMTLIAERGDVTLDIERAVIRYARAAAIAQRAWAEVPADTLLTTGSTGQLVAHPAIAIAQAADREAAKYAKELGIEGSTKRGPGRPVGAVSAPDRAAAPPKLRMLRDAG